MLIRGPVALTIGGRTPPNPPTLLTPLKFVTPPVNGGLPNPSCGPPTTLGAPTGVTTPGLFWIPGVIGSASITGDITGLTIGATIGWRITGCGAITGVTTGGAITGAGATTGVG